MRRNRLQWSRFSIFSVLTLGFYLGCLVLTKEAAATSEFAAIDGEAIYAPPSECESVEKLAAYLTRTATNERQKARAFFRWITANISYDAETLGYGTDESAEAVLKRRTAVCVGYSNLFQALASAANMYAVTILGDSKSNDYRGSFESRRKHQWNAIKIDGKWELVDCTWGAGSINSRGQFIHDTQDHYFCTPPEIFVEDHLPLDSAWQLLPIPLTPEEYESRVCRRPAYYRYQLGPLSHTSAILTPAESLTITVGAPPGVYVFALLLKGGQEVKGMTFTQREGQNFVIRVNLPATDVYVLRVFARGENENILQYHEALHYQIYAKGCNKAFVGFPETCNTFEEAGVSLETPFTRVLPLGEEVFFSLRAPQAIELCVSPYTAKQPWAVLEKNGDLFSGKVKIESEGDVYVWGLFPNASSHFSLLLYNAKKATHQPTDTPVNNISTPLTEVMPAGVKEETTIAAPTTTASLPLAKVVELATFVQYQPDSLIAKKVWDTQISTLTVLAADATIPFNGNSESESSFLYLLEGIAEINLGENHIVLSAGQGLLVPAFTNYQGRAQSQCKILVFQPHNLAKQNNQAIQ